MVGKGDGETGGGGGVTSDESAAFPGRVTSIVNLLRDFFNIH